MSNWKSQAPAELALPSSKEPIDHCRYSTPRQSMGSSPFPLGGVQQFPILTAESLASPVEPGFLQGASSVARFGLDIGGTLCKVVYFEPAVDSLIDCSRTTLSKFSRSTTGSDTSPVRCTNGKLGNVPQGARLSEQADSIGDCVLGCADSKVSPCDTEKNGCAGNGHSFSRLHEDYNGTELMTSDFETVTLTSTSTQGPLGVQDEKRESNHKMEYQEEDSNGTTAGASQDNYHCRCRISDVQRSGHHKEDTRVPTGVAGKDDPNSRRQAKKIWVSSHEPVHLPGRGTLYFKCFETWRMEEFLNLTKEYSLVTGGRAIGATGGGAKKFGDQFLDIAGLQLQRADELTSLVRGIDFLARHAQQESFEYPTGSYQGGTIQRPWQSPENSSDDGGGLSSEEDSSSILSIEGSELETSSSTIPSARPGVGLQERHKRASKVKGSTLKRPLLTRLDSLVWMGSNNPRHPYLLVNIGSGVSILRVDSADKFERVGGTSLGGSTFLGLAAALTGCQSFEEAISLAMEGDSTHVDMLVGDIYGGDYTEMGLAATTVASSFGKLVQPGKKVETQQPHHLAKAALLMVTNNIGSIALLHARNASVHSVVFTGSFLHNNKLAIRLLAVAMEFWSKGEMKAEFLRHEGHAGAMGALLGSLEQSNPIDALLLN